MDAGNLLKPLLARGELHCIGATTLNEYRLYIEKDAALERRFQPVMVPEPSVEDTVAILRGLKERYEIYHGVKIQDAALISAAVLSNRYISDRFLPDKAIDLVDEACALIKTEMNSMPTELDEISHKIMQLEIEEAALGKETDKLSLEHLADIRRELGDLRDRFNQMKVKWESEKSAIGKVQKIREEIDAVNAEIDKAQNAYDLTKAAELKYGKLPGLKKELEAAEAAGEGETKTTLLRDKVTEDEIARIVSRWTGIPVAKLVESEREKLLGLDAILHRRVIGQDEGVTKVSEAILRSRAGIQDPKRPIGSFLVLGPTGVGKTELTRALAAVLFGSESGVIRLDMSEYTEKFSVSRLVGSPPGYVGFDEGGQLTGQVRRRPYSIVLFDEIEKADPEVFNLLLQILEEGCLTDSTGRRADFRNTVVVLTSNVGAHLLTQHRDKLGFAAEQGDRARADRLRELVDDEVRKVFRPELLNRIDEIILFRSLSPDELRQIAARMLDRLAARSAENPGLTLRFDASVADRIAAASGTGRYGARPLRRAVTSDVEDVLSERLLAGDLHPGGVYDVRWQEGALVVDEVREAVDNPDK